MTEEIIIDEFAKSTWNLLEEIKKRQDENKDLREDIHRLEQENKELKEEKLYRGIDRQFIEDANDRLYFKAEKYRKALKEIREIADKCKECLNEDDDCGCDYLRIKRRIDEVLGDENN